MLKISTINRQKFAEFLFSIICIFFTMLLSGCNGDSIVPNEIPTATITSPTDGDTYSYESIIVFNGYGEDTEDINLTGASLVWNSSIDGQFGTGRSFTTNSLSAGIHTITLTVFDGGGASGTATVSILVLEPGANTLPIAQITSPLADSEYNVGDNVIFEGSGTDAEDGNLTGASLVWTSSIDGELGTGALFVLDNLSEGDHAITLTATDSQGATDSDLIQMTINP